MLPGLKKRVINFHDVLMYVAIFQRHLRLMALIICFSWLSGLVFYVYARPVYFSRSLIKVDGLNQQVAVDKVFPEGRYNSLIQRLTAPHIVERTAARLGVVSEYRELMKSKIKKLTGRINTEGNIEIEFYPYSLDWSKRWVETMLKEFLEYREIRRAEEWEQRRGLIQKDIQDLQKLAEQNQVSVNEMRSQLDTDRAKLRYDELVSLPVHLVQVKQRLDALGRLRMDIIDPDLTTIEKLSRASAVAEKLPVGTVITNNTTSPPAATEEDNTTTPEAPKSDSLNIQIVTPGISQSGGAWRELADKLHNLEMQREHLSVNFLPTHHKIKDIQKQIDQVNMQLESELQNVTKNIEMEFSYILDQERRLEDKFPEYLKRQKELKTAQQKMSFTQASQIRWNGYMLSRMKQEEISEYAMDRERAILTYAGLIEFRDLPISPNRFSLFLYTTLLGVFLALGIPFLIEYLDHTLSNLEEVESTFQIRGLGIIPKMEDTEASVALINRDHAKEHNLLENFRVIRTNLLSMGSLSKPPHVLMITSAMPKEGKTVISTNLALSFAQTGAKTLLIDTDLRRGRLHRLFGYRKQPGLSGVLLGQHSLDEAIRPTPHENLSIVSAGQHVDTGTELLGSQKFADIMSELRKRFDRIVVDTPPVLGLSETSVLQGQVDGVLFVIWSAHTPIKAVKSAIEILQGNGANFYGFVLNRLDLSATANYYQYYYYSHDYYYQYQPTHQLENS